MGHTGALCFVLGHSGRRGWVSTPGTGAGPSSHQGVAFVCLPCVPKLPEARIWRLAAGLVIPITTHAIVLSSQAALGCKGLIRARCFPRAQEPPRKRTHSRALCVTSTNWEGLQVLLCCVALGCPKS